MKLKIFQNNSLIEFLQGHKIKNSSGTLTQRESIKFTGDVTVTDDSTNNQTVINVTGGGSGGHTILDSSGTAMNQRGKLQFVGATVTDDSTNDKTIITTTPQSMIGDAWVLGHAYAVGDYCIDGNVLYKCKTAHTSSASYRPPYASYWDAVSVASQLCNNTFTSTDVTIKGQKYRFQKSGKIVFVGAINGTINTNLSVNQAMIAPSDIPSGYAIASGFGTNGMGMSGSTPIRIDVDSTNGISSTSAISSGTAVRFQLSYITV